MEPERIDPDQEIREMVEDLKFIERCCRSGTSDAELRHMTAQMREIADGQLQHVWRLAEMGSKQPNIECTMLNMSTISTDAYALVGGGADYDPTLDYSTIRNPTAEQITAEQKRNIRPGYFGPVAIFSNDENGDRLLHRSPPEGFTIVLDNGSSLEMNHNQLKSGRLASSEYFKSTALVAQGFKVSRHSIVRHVAISQNGVHSRRTSKPRDVKEDEVLKNVQQHQTINRGTIMYLHQSIAQDIVKSLDVKRFMEKFK